jgi:hypothetical protein
MILNACRILDEHVYIRSPASSEVYSINQHSNNLQVYLHLQLRAATLQQDMSEMCLYQHTIYICQHLASTNLLIYCPSGQQGQQCGFRDFIPPQILHVLCHRCKIYYLTGASILED